MNRHEEYVSLLRELEQTPPELTNTVERALIRERVLQKKRWRISFGGLAAFFVCFVLLVNLSIPFARACETIPVLWELAKAVSWSPSLSAAVENEYAQPIGQSQSANGITATIEYVIVDRKQVNIFYKLESGEYGQLEADSCITLPENDGGYTSGSSSYGIPNGELRSVRVDFLDWDVPDTLDLTLSVWAQKPEQEEPSEEYTFDSEFERSVMEPVYLAEFIFTLMFDPYHTAQGETIPVNASFLLDGQVMTLTEVELYPTHLRVNLEDDEDNTAWLESMELYLENEHGERFYASTNGVSAAGEPDGEGMGTFWLDSPFFSQGKNLTLCITRVKWREKSAPMTRLDLRKGTAENLPDGVRFLGAAECPHGWLVSFSAPLEDENRMYS